MFFLFKNGAPKSAAQWALSMYTYSISTVHTVLQRILQTRAHKDLPLGTKLCLVLKWVLQHCQAWAPSGASSFSGEIISTCSSRVPPSYPAQRSNWTTNLQWDGLWSKCFATGNYAPPPASTHFSLTHVRVFIVIETQEWWVCTEWRWRGAALIVSVVGIFLGPRQTSSEKVVFESFRLQLWSYLGNNGTVTYKTIIQQTYNIIHTTN